MSYRHTLKRFPIDRHQDEEVRDFLNRVNMESKYEQDKIEQENYISTDIHMSNIYGDKEESFRTIKTVVVEINEIPDMIDIEFFRLAVYHNEIKKEEDGEIVDISYFTRNLIVSPFLIFNP